MASQSGRAGGVTAPPMPEDPGGEFRGVTPTTGADSGQKSPLLELNEAQRRQEHLYAAALAGEFGRIKFGRVYPLASARIASRYASTVVDNSRALAAGNPRVHMGLLRGQLRWLRSLPMGSGELRW
jgi:hypothetical protein